MGKRLCTAAEYEAALRQANSTFEALRWLPLATHNFGKVGEPTTDTTKTALAIFGLRSNVAEWTISRDARLPSDKELETGEIPLDHRIVLGWSADSARLAGFEPAEIARTRHVILQRNTQTKGVGFRCVRSEKPRFIE